MRIRPVGTSLLIELIERATRKSGILVKSDEDRVFIGKVLNLSTHLAMNGHVNKGDSVLFVGRSVDTPLEGQFIIDMEQIIGVLEHDEEGN